MTIAAILVSFALLKVPNLHNVFRLNPVYGQIICPYVFCICPPAMGTHSHNASEGHKIRSNTRYASKKIFFFSFNFFLD